MRRGNRIYLSIIAAILAINLSVTAVSANTGSGQSKTKQSKMTEIEDMIVTVDGAEVVFLDVAPVIQQERTLVPLRAIFEAMGAVVQWDQETKTITAVKEDESVMLTIDSKTALANNDEIALEVSPTVYKGRTLVPLRFIGEAFNGIVNYDRETKNISISLTGEGEVTPPPVQAPKFYLNNNELELDVPPIMKKGKNYIPLKNVLDGLGNEVFWKQEGEEIFVQFDGAKMTLFVDSNEAIVNDEKVTITEYPIHHNGTVMAPIRFITEAFGGTAHYEKDTGNTHLYINRAKFKHEFLEKETVSIMHPTNVPSAKLVGERRLMLSDNPEILNEDTIPEDDVTLWHDEVNATKSAVNHRVYGWHINRLDTSAVIGITIENLSSSQLEITDLKGVNRISSNGWSNYDVGLPLAETVLSDKLTNIKMSDYIVEPGETAVIQSFKVDKEFLLGFTNDFTIENKSSSEPLHYKVRTVLSKTDGDLTTINKEPVPLDRVNAHPRGTWQSSEIEAEFPVYEAGSSDVAYSLSNGKTDNLLSDSASLGEQADGVISNVGHYGVVYKVKIPVINHTGETKKVRVRIGGRGGLYNGAIKTEDGVYLTPVLQPMYEVANVKDYEISGTEETIELEIMHAGGSALAMAVEVLTVK